MTIDRDNNPYTCLGGSCASSPLECMTIPFAFTLTPSDYCLTQCWDGSCQNIYHYCPPVPRCDLDVPKRYERRETERRGSSGGGESGPFIFVSPFPSYNPVSYHICDEIHAYFSLFPSPLPSPLLLLANSLTQMSNGSVRES